MTRKRPAKNKKEGTVNESSVSYKSKDQIHFFKSFEEMEEDNYKWLASLTPTEHLRNATELIKRVFAVDLKKKPTIGKTIYFK
jgi:hypothetical protein